MVDEFYSLLKQRIQTHDFKPVIIDQRKIANRKYDHSEKGKAKHKAWRQTPAGKESCARITKKYVQSHPEVRRAISARFYEKHKDEIAEKRKQKRLADPEAARKKRKSWPSSQPEYVSAYMKAYRAKKKAEKLALEKVSEKTPISA